MVGVTKNHGQCPQVVRFKVDKTSAPYVLTKPIHASQQIEEITEGGTVFSISVVLNLELERELLGFGEALEVLSPLRLRNRMMYRLQLMRKIYEV